MVVASADMDGGGLVLPRAGDTVGNDSEVPPPPAASDVNGFVDEDGVETPVGSSRLNPFFAGG